MNAIATHLLEYLTQKIAVMPKAGEDLEKPGLSYTLENS